LNWYYLFTLPKLFLLLRNPKVHLHSHEYIIKHVTEEAQCRSEITGYVS